MKWSPVGSNLSEFFSGNNPRTFRLIVSYRKIGKLDDGRVCVAAEVTDKGLFKGVGNNLRIARCTAAKYALRELEAMQLEQ